MKKTSALLQVYEEAGSDFHQVAYFRTRIGLRNALQEEISGSSDKEAVLITLNRPIVFAQPVAFDRGSFGFCLTHLSVLLTSGAVPQHCFPPLCSGAVLAEL